MAIERKESYAPGRENLVNSLLSLDNAQDIENFLLDLCTPRELEDLSQRLEVARMLDAGISYVRIQDLTGASATTVARVARCLKYGPGGYAAALKKLPPYNG
ncbi:MAG: TrpR-like protein YerC/YecD [Coriobacteriales bacterium]|nr:TrpR-like protein YerC/YecD [Coriobacteriales bacterium]